MLTRILALSFLISMPTFAADECQPQVIDPNVLTDLSRVSNSLKIECPHQLHVGQLCNAVADQLTEQDSAAGTKFSFQTMIYNASCVEVSKDSPEIIQAKIQNFWNKYHDDLNCNQLGFTITNGHILKLAVERNSKDFINDAVRKWKLNLNHVDPADQKTVLDFISRELEKAKGTSYEPVLQRYFDLFRRNGAKFKSEL